MRIGFDLDGIFIDKPPLVPKKLIEWFYRGHDHALFYRFPPRIEQWVRNMTHVSFLRPPLVENVKYIKRIRQTNTHSYYLISSRFSFLKKKTEKILARYQLTALFDGMYFNFHDKQPHLFKDEIISMLHIDQYIDDDLPLLRFLAGKHPHRTFFWLNKTRKGQPLAKNLVAITDLSQIPI